MRWTLRAVDALAAIIVNFGGGSYVCVRCGGSELVICFPASSGAGQFFKPSQTSWLQHVLASSTGPVDRQLITGQFARGHLLVLCPR